MTRPVDVTPDAELSTEPAAESEPQPGTGPGVEPGTGSDVEPRRAPWWRDAARRNRVAVVSFGVLALGGILFPAFTNYLFAGDRRVMVVQMVNDAGQANREGLKAACGSLPGISVVADRGNPDPRIQGRLPVRFNIADTTQAQETALIGCLNDNKPRFGVVGYLPENDGN